MATAPPEAIRSTASVSNSEAGATASRAPQAAAQRATGGPSPSSPGPSRPDEAPSLTSPEEADEPLPWLSAFTDGLDESKKKPPYHEVWKNHRDASNEPPTVKTRAELEARLAGDSQQTSGLLDLLDRDGLSSPANLSALDHLRQRVGPEKAEKAVARLRDFYLKQGNAEPNQRLLQDVLHDLATPSDIDQGDKGTCTMTSVQMKWAMEDPESYARCLTELHARGSCQMPDGSTLTRNDSSQGNAEDKRSLSVRYLSDSLMGSCTSLWSGHLGGYDSTDPKAGGRTSSETLDALNRIFPNQGYSNNTSWGSSGKSLLSYLEDDLARGRSVTASVPGHHILVVGLDKSGPEPQVILNTWGEQKIMPVAEFEKYLRAVETVDDSGWDNRKTPEGKLTLMGDR